MNTMNSTEATNKILKFFEIIVGVVELVFLAEKEKNSEFNSVIEIFSVFFFLRIADV